jgi:hypothetical protein
MIESKRAFTWFMVLGALGCSGAGKGGFAADDVDASSAPSNAFRGFADAGGALQAHLEVNGNDLPCGSCAVLVAQAAGGKQPYSYAWSDPSLSGPGPHTVCPTQATHYEVVVTDSSSMASGEIARSAETATAAADVTCEQPARDAGDAGDDDFAGCVSSNGESPEPCSIDAGSGVAEVHSQRVLFTPVAGNTYQFSYDQVLPIAVGTAVTVDVYGAMAKCGTDQKLFTLVLDGRWNQSYCFTASESFLYSTSVVRTAGSLVNFDFAVNGIDCAGCADGGAD